MQNQVIGTTGLILLLTAAHAAEVQHSLRGGIRAEEPLNRFSWIHDMQGENDDSMLTTFHRGLQETVIVIPIVPIILIIVLICICCNKNQQATRQQVLQQQARHQQTAGAVQMTTASKPKLVTAAAIKFSPDARTGVNFVKGTDYAQISSITADSIFKDTELAPGMKIVSINNISINSGEHAAAVISGSPSMLTILAHTAGYFGTTENFVTATVCKEHPDQPIGVVFGNEDQYSTFIRLKRFTDTSPFADSELSAGMELVAVNNNVTIHSAKDAKNLALNAFPLVTILARRSKAVAVSLDPADNEPVVTATVLGVPDFD